MAEDPFYGLGRANAQPESRSDSLRVEFYRGHYIISLPPRLAAGDPLGTRNMSDKYVYSLDDPISNKDPFGLFTLGVGLTVNVQVGIINIQGSYGVVVDSSGNFGVYGNAGAGAGVGAEASVGIGFQTSNAHTICDLAGPFQYGNANAGYGIDGSLDEFSGFSADGGPVIGGGMTIGAGVGGGASHGVIPRLSSRSRLELLPDRWWFRLDRG